MYFTAVKRDGRTDDFDAAKITAALLKAGKATGEFDDRESINHAGLSLAVRCACRKRRMWKAFRMLWSRCCLILPLGQTAKAYILYREQRAQLRRVKTKANLDLMEGYLNKMDWRCENSNMGFSLQGLNNYVSSDITSEYWLNRIYQPYAMRIQTAIFTCTTLTCFPFIVLAGIWRISCAMALKAWPECGKRATQAFSLRPGAIGQFFYTLQGEAVSTGCVQILTHLAGPVHPA